MKTPPRFVVSLGLIFGIGMMLFLGCGRIFSGNPRIEGTVRLEGQSNHEGVKAFVPGTARVAYTDREGRFLLDQLHPGAVELVLEKEGYQPHRQKLTLKTGQIHRMTQAINLLPLQADSLGGGIRGSLSLQGQKDAGGALILVQGEGFHATANTDSTGKFALMNLPPGIYQFFAFKPGYVTYSESVEVIAGEDLEFDQIQLTTGESTQDQESVPALVVQGRARLDGKTDHSGILVSVDGTSLVSITDENGRFILQDFPSGAQNVSFRKAGYETARLQNVVATATEEITMNLQPETAAPQTGSVEGFVQFEGGFATDLSGVQIVLEGKLTYQTKSQASGAYRISGVEPGLYQLTATTDGYEPYELLGVQVRPGESTFVPYLVLSPREELITAFSDASELSGSVRLDNKTNHQGILVQLEGTHLLTLTDDQGEYVFQDVATGIYRVVFNYSGYRSERIESVQVIQGQSVTLGPVTLYPERDRPYVLFTEPGDRTQGVPVDEFMDILVVFSERMDERSVRQAVQITPQVSHRIYFGSEHPQSGNDRIVIRFQKEGSPTIQLQQEYRIEIAQSAQSLMGEELGEPYVFSFVTSGARIVRVFPHDGETEVFLGINNYIIVDFNARINYSTFLQSVTIQPNPPSKPIMFPERVPSGDRVKLEVDLRDDTRYTVTIGTRVRTTDGKPVENTPYRFSFRTGSIEGTEDYIDDLIFSRERDF